MTETMTSASPSGERATEWMVPASYAQERIWFASQMARDVPVYHVVDEIRLGYRLAADRVRAVLARLCARHETLRTSLRLDGDGALMQVVHGHVELPVQDIDLSAEPEHVHDVRIAELTMEMARAELPLDRAPLWRGLLVRRDEDTWSLVLVAHHAVVDAASELTLRAELRELCAAEAERPGSNGKAALRRTAVAPPTPRSCARHGRAAASWLAAQTGRPYRCRHRDAYACTISRSNRALWSVSCDGTCATSSRVMAPCSCA